MEFDSLNEAWLLSHLLMLVFTQSHGVAHTGLLPQTPSTPQCSIPYDTNEDLTIQCSWDPGPDQDPSLSASYSIHWAADLDTKSYSDACERYSGVIPRDNYSSHRILKVWVVAKNQYGFVHSDNATFRTDEIRVPPVPNITKISSGYLEITWDSGCSKLELSERDCEVRYRPEDQQKWAEVVENLHRSFELLNPLPFTEYEFQVRCGCTGSILMSEWSSVTVQSVATSGKMDVWSDCESLSVLSKCALMWKHPLVVDGAVLGFVVTISYNNGTAETVSMSTTGYEGRSGCKGKQCYLRSSLLGVSGVHVSARTPQDTTEPTFFALPSPDVQGPELSIVCKIDEVNLLVSWNLSSQLHNNLLELVVQYKQTGLPLSQGFGWRKVHNSQTSITLSGSFENYTSYIVSLFGVQRFGNSSVFSGSPHSVFLSSTIGYVREGAPPQVPWIKVQDITDSQVTLSWGRIPLSQTRGVILHYLLEVDQQMVGNVSAEKNTYVIPDLSPDQTYEVGILAVTKAGSGQAKIIHITTKEKQDYDMSVYIFIVVVLILLFIGFAHKILLGCSKVPDPKNSQLFQQMTKSQVSWAFVCAPSELSPKISQLKVVQIEHGNVPGKTGPLMVKGAEGEGIGTVTEDEKKHVDLERGWMKIKGKGKFDEEAYSTMIDTDEENIDGRTVSLSEEDMFFSDYEKHFMPIAVDV